MTTVYIQIGTFLTRLAAAASTVLLTIIMGGFTLIVFATVAPFRVAGMTKRLAEVKSDWHDQADEQEEFTSAERDEEPIQPTHSISQSENTFALSHLLSKTGKVTLAKALVGLTAKTILFVVLCATCCFGQSTRAHSAVRISEDNDWFTGTDKYYTNGIRLDYIYEAKRTTAFDRLLIGIPSFDARVRGIGIVQTMYTPGDVNETGVVANDHPYAGTLYLNNFQETFNLEKKIKVYSELDLGVIGPDAYAGETQAWFHKLIHDDVPRGWNNQVESGLVANYTASIEKGLTSFSRVELIGHGGADFGTTMTDINAGLILRAGLLDNYFKSRFQQDNKFHAYTFFKSGMMIMIEDQTLQGKLEGSQYAINSSEVNHSLWRLEYGITLTSNWFALSYSTVTLSKEFVHADIHQYGNVTLTFKIH